jgi:Protein of unknown function (DUF1573)
MLCAIGRQGRASDTADGDHRPGRQGPESTTSMEWCFRHSCSERTVNGTTTGGFLRMSKRLFATTLAFALTVTAPLAVIAQEKKTEKQAAEAVARAPRLSLVEPIKDFGTVPKGEKLDWSFEIRNTGTADLEILAAKPACGCTVADFDKVIKPGAIGKITAHVDTASFSGPISKAVMLETNDPSAPTAQVTISAVVKPFVEAFPTGFVRFNLIQGDVEKQSLTLFSEEEAPFEIVKIESPTEYIKAEYAKLDSASLVPNVGRSGQNQYRLDITVGGDDARIGPLAEKIRIITNSKHQPDYWVSVTGVIRPSVRVEPSGINFGEISPSDATAATRVVSFRSMDLKTPEAFVVTKAESGIPGLTTSIKPTEKKGEYLVTLQVSKDAKPGVIDGNVTVYTSDRVRSTVVIPVTGTIKSAS